MEIKTKLFIASLLIFVISCAGSALLSHRIQEVYVADFISDDMERCRPSDVDLDNHEVKMFFTQGREVPHKVIHDHYNYAPCYIEGTLKYDSSFCEWQIRAGATGFIKCEKETTYYVCDTCNDLFNGKESK